MSQAILTLNNLKKVYTDDTVIGPFNLEINEGEFLTLLGPSGCGKTTLLRLLSGFETPDSGQIKINNHDITKLPPEKRNINMVFQNYALFPHMTVYENVAFGLHCQKIPKKEITARVNDMLDKVRLTKYAKRKPNELSGGQQQRVAIARAAVNEPSILLLDEPLSALDYHLRKDMRRKLKSLQRRLGITFIMVTHDQEEALSMSDRIAVMHEGTIEQLGSPRDVYEEPINLRVARFVGDTNIFNTEIIDCNEKEFSVCIINKGFTYKNQNKYQLGDRVNIVMRPEDFEVWGKRELSDISDALPGKVSDIIYNGSTVDLWVKLDNEQTIHATEFFDEDDENLDYKLGESVMVRWKKGWEVILPHEIETNSP